MKLNSNPPLDLSRAIKIFKFYFLLLHIYAQSTEKLQNFPSTNMINESFFDEGGDEEDYNH